MNIPTSVPPISKPATPSSTSPPPPPSTGANLSLFLLDDDETRLFQPTDEEAVKRMKEQQARLLPLRQEFEHMSEEHRKLKNQKGDTTAVIAQLNDCWHDGLVNSWHRGSWAELYPLIKGISQVGQPEFRQNIFVLGGQFGTLGKSFSKLIPPPRTLVDSLERHYVFPKTTELFHRWEVSKLPADQKALEDQISQSAALYDSVWGDQAKLKALASTAVPRLRASAESRLFNLPASTMCFEPTATDLTLGWQQLWKFAWLFNKLPDITKDKFKPYHFTIRSMPPLVPPVTSPASAGSGRLTSP